MGLARFLKRFMPASSIGQLTMLILLTIAVTYYSQSTQQFGQFRGESDNAPPFLEHSYRKHHRLSASSNTANGNHLTVSVSNSKASRTPENLKQVTRTRKIPYDSSNAKERLTPGHDPRVIQARDLENFDYNAKVDSYMPKIDSKDHGIKRSDSLVIRARDMGTPGENVNVNDLGDRLHLPEKEDNTDVGKMFHKPSSKSLFKYDDTPKVIILAYYRSGFTMTGSLFNSNPRAFYVFEPLYNLYQKNIGHGQPLRFFNGSTMLPPSFGHEIPFVHAVLGAYLTCDFSNIDIGSLIYGLASMSSPHLLRYIHCHRGHMKNIEYVRSVCMKQLHDDCIKADIRAIKEIRLSMQTLDFLLEQIPSLKVIHLMQDSRAMICSQTNKPTCEIKEPLIRQICAKLKTDIDRRLILQKKYPGRIKWIKYESLAVNPIALARNVYKFLQRNLPKEVEEFYENTMSGKNFTVAMGATRPDSIATIYQWSRQIDWGIAKKIQKYCKVPLERGKYPLYSNEAQLRKAKIPKRPKIRTSLIPVP